MMDSKQGPPPDYAQAQGGYPQQPAGYPPGPPPTGYPQQPPPQGYPQQPPPQGYPQQPPSQGYPQQPPSQGYPQQPPPQGYGQPAPQTTTVVINQPVMTSMSEVPVSMTCPQCRATITTRVVYTNGMLVWLICLGLILFGCWLGCCLIPFCMESVKDVEHYCPSCNRLIGVKKRM